jgi:hypothetical protein
MWRTLAVERERKIRLQEEEITQLQAINANLNLEVQCVFPDFCVVTYTMTGVLPVQRNRKPVSPLQNTHRARFACGTGEFGGSRRTQQTKDRNYRTENKASGD